MQSVHRARCCLSACLDLIDDLSPFHMEKFRQELERRSTADLATFDYLLVLFAALCCSLEAWRTQNFPELQEILQSDRHLVTRRRFALLLIVVIYFRHNHENRILRRLWFLLHYRGLSNTGFHLLHEFGLGPTVRSLPVLFKSLVPDQMPPAPQAVWWFDNLRRKLAGNAPQPGERVDWTVVGYSALQIEESTPAFGDFWAFVDPLSDELVLELSEKLRESDQLDLTSEATYFYNATRFSVPLRAENPCKYEFGRLDVLPVACGTPVGTAALLKYVTDHLLSEDRFTVVTLDYDLYWRVMKFFYTRSLVASYPQLKKQMILILAPWHVFKRTVEVIWNFFAPGIFARLWLATFHRPVPSSPDLKDMMFFLTALALCTKRSARWQVESCMGHCLRVLICRLVPLVSEFFATEYSKISNMIDTGVRTWHVNTEQRHPPVY